MSTAVTRSYHWTGAVQKIPNCYPVVIRFARQGSLWARTAKPQTVMADSGKSSAVRFASQRPVSAPVTIKTGTTARRTGDAPGTKRFQALTVFPLTATACNSSVPMHCAPNVNATIPASNPQDRSDYGYETGQVRQTSTHWLIFWHYPLHSPPSFSTAFTPIAAQNNCEESFDFTFFLCLGAVLWLCLFVLPFLLSDLLQFFFAYLFSIFYRVFCSWL